MVNNFLSKDKLIDLLVLILINILAIIVSLVTHAVFIVSATLFLILPSLYLLTKAKNRKKVFLATITLGTIYSFSFDFLAELNNAWNWRGGC